MDDTDAFGHWFAGFVDGEGCFDIHPIRGPGTVSYICRLSIGLRWDDAPILREIQQRTGLGDLRHHTANGGPRGNTGNQARWTVAKKAEVAQLVLLFDRYPLRAKKRNDYLIWREAVARWLEVRSKRKHDWTAMQELRTALMQGRRYSEENAPVIKLPERTQLKLIA